jgi:hypothetical protein|nr:MAG TPA: hypothetical protein [Caudoviricetes sp.]
MPGILDLFQGKTTTPAEPPVTPKNENLIDFQVTLYDKWLADWFKHGNLPTHSYDCGKGHNFVEIYHPERANFPTSNMYGANSRSFVLSKDYDIKEHARRFVGGHNNLFGWDRKGTPIYYGCWVPVYSNTIDKVIIECNRPENIANRLTEWLDNEREREIAWQMEANSQDATFRLTRQRIDDAIKNL